MTLHSGGLADPHRSHALLLPLCFQVCERSATPSVQTSLLPVQQPNTEMKGHSYIEYLRVSDSRGRRHNVFGLTAHPIVVNAENALGEFIQIWHKCPRGLQEELIA